MKYEIVELEEYCGPMGKVYSVYLNDDDKTLFEQFVTEYKDEFPDEINSIDIRLTAMANDWGMVPRFFKTAEGTKDTDKVVALVDAEGQLRVYGIWLNDKLIIIGGGGPKPAGKIIKWQDDPTLKKEAERVIAIGRDLQKRIDEGIVEINGAEIDIEEEE